MKKTPRDRAFWEGRIKQLERDLRDAAFHRASFRKAALQLLRQKPSNPRHIAKRHRNLSALRKKEHELDRKERVLAFCKARIIELDNRSRFDRVLRDVV